MKFRCRQTQDELSTEPVNQETYWQCLTLGATRTLMNIIK